MVAPGRPVYLGGMLFDVVKTVSWMIGVLQQAWQAGGGGGGD
jgi:hypothetical protein